MKKSVIAIACLAASVSMGSVFAADAEAGKAKAASCGGCHGADGVSMVPTYPNLKGQKEAYLVKAMTDYKTGTRPDATMKAMVGALSDEDIANIAAHYAGLK
jgi:cytochrome c553